MVDWGSAPLHPTPRGVARGGHLGMNSCFLRHWHIFPTSYRANGHAQTPNPRAARPSRPTHHEPLDGAKWSFSLVSEAWQVLCFPAWVPGRGTRTSQKLGAQLSIGRVGSLC